MGYRVQQTHYVLRFEDSNLAGLEVRARVASASAHVTVSRHFALMAELRDQTRARPGDIPTRARLDQLGEIYQAFGEALVAWNLQDEHGTPIPATYRNLMAQEFPLVVEIVNAWVTAVVDGWAKTMADQDTDQDTGAAQPPVTEVALPVEPLQVGGS